MATYNKTATSSWAIAAYSAATLLSVYSGAIEYAFSPVDTTPTIMGHTLQAGESVRFTASEFAAFGAALWIRDLTTGDSSVVAIDGDGTP